MRHSLLNSKVNLVDYVFIKNYFNVNNIAPKAKKATASESLLFKTLTRTVGRPDSKTFFC